MSEATEIERKCEYCKEPGATARAAAPAFEGAAQQHEYHHDRCYEMVVILRMYQQLFNATNKLNLMPFDVALRRVAQTKFVGFLDVRLVNEDRRSIIESSVKVRLRPFAERSAPKGWASIPISPDIADAIHRGLAVGEGISPEHSDRVDQVLDVDVSKQNETREDLS